MNKYFLFIFCLLVIPLDRVNAQNDSWSVEECIDYALKNNLLIKRASLTNDINEKTLEQSFANRIPIVSANASQNVNFGRSIDPSSNQFIVQKILSNNFGLSGSLVLFNGFQNNNTIELNKLNYQAGTYDIEKSKNDIILNILGYYLQVLMFAEQEEAAKMQMQNSISQVEKNEKLFNKGMITEDVYFKMKSQVATDEQNTITIINQLMLAKLSLCQQMQIQFNDEFKIDKINVEFDSLTVDNSSSKEIYQVAEKIMPQVKSNELKLKSSHYSLKAYKAGYFPKLTLNAGISTIYSDQNKEVTNPSGQYLVNVGFVNYDQNYPVYTLYQSFNRQTIPFDKQLSNNLYQYVNLNLSIPIISAKTNKINVGKSKINISLTEVNKEVVKNQLRQDIETAYNNYLAAVKKYNATKTNLETKRISYRITEKRHNAGYLNIYNYLDEKNGLTKAELDFLQAKYDVIFRKKIIDFYQGNPNF